MTAALYSNSNQLQCNPGNKCMKLRSDYPMLFAIHNQLMFELLNEKKKNFFYIGGAIDKVSPL